MTSPTPVSLFLTVLGLCFLCIGIVTVLKPISRVGVTSRKRAAGLIFLGFVLLCMSNAVTATPGMTTAPMDLGAGLKPVPDAPAEQPRAALPMPEREVNFIKIIRATRDAYGRAPNEMAKGGMRPCRKTGLCLVVSQPTVKDWTGHIRQLSSNGEGKGVLSITLDDGLTVSTWNNDLSDAGSHTLIDPASSLFAAASALKEGDPVVFSGTFFPDQTDCIREQSLSLEGSMTDPEFVFRFTSITAFH